MVKWKKVKYIICVGRVSIIIVQDDFLFAKNIFNTILPYLSKVFVDKILFKRK